MKPSFQNFYKFLKSNSNLEQYKEILHELLFLNEQSLRLNIIGLQRKFEFAGYNISKETLREIFFGLIKAKVIKINEEIECDNCEEENYIKDANIICSHCDEELNENDIFMDIDSFLSIDNFSLLKNSYLNKKKIDKIIEEWQTKEYLVYILLDIVDSQNVQNNLKEEDYTKLLDDIREIIKGECLSHINGESIVFGEIGDCFKIALTHKQDAIKFFELFSKRLYEYTKDNKYPKVDKKIVPFYPCFSACVTALPLPKSYGRNISVKDTLSVTLNGSFDMNSKELTSFFRLDSSVKIQNDKIFNEYNLSVCCTKDLLEKVKVNNINRTNIEVKKGNKILETTQVGLIFFNKDTYTTAKNCKDYLKLS
ncbi:MAG: hypothetical protein CL623_12865 [Arcobacter sp.]|nr:hypothetical protein [Arcobacter sp.]|tara:strand:- start:1200 stop:2300 length:1101 start_codon:yes stop_codon:yes gene_type:complete